MSCWQDTLWLPGFRIIYYYWYSALGPFWAETRVQSGDWYDSGTLHPGQVLRVACHCFPAFRIIYHLKLGGIVIFCISDYIISHFHYIRSYMFSGLLHSRLQDFRYFITPNFTVLNYKVKVMVKQSRNRPGVAQRVPGGLDSHIPMTFGTLRWGGCQPHAPAAFAPRKCS